jgi:hypothetical protein
VERVLLILVAETPGAQADPGREELVRRIQGRIDYDRILAVPLDAGLRRLREAVAGEVAAGVGQLVGIPFLLAPRPGESESLRRTFEELARAFPEAEMALTGPLGADDRIADIVCDLARGAEMGMRTSAGRPVLSVDGLVRTPLKLSYGDLRRAPGQIEDVGTLAPGRKGSGVRVGEILRIAGPAPSAGRITFHSSDGDFQASIVLSEAEDRGIFIYRFGEGPLPESMGGPVRLVIPGTDDVCNNVKRVIRVEIQP